MFCGFAKFLKIIHAQLLFFIITDLFLSSSLLLLRIHLAGESAAWGVDGELGSELGSESTFTKLNLIICI